MKTIHLCRPGDERALALAGSADLGLKRIFLLGKAQGNVTWRA
jgi:hypothetical protein